MSGECSECECNVHHGHDPSCSRYRASEAERALAEIEHLASIQEQQSLFTQVVLNKARRGLGKPLIRFNQRKAST
jgi:hypothetical protein